MSAARAEQTMTAVLISELIGAGPSEVVDLECPEALSLEDTLEDALEDVEDGLGSAETTLSDPPVAALAAAMVQESPLEL